MLLFESRLHFNACFKKSILNEMKKSVSHWVLGCAIHTKFFLRNVSSHFSLHIHVCRISLAMIEHFQIVTYQLTKIASNILWSKNYEYKIKRVRAGP